MAKLILKRRSPSQVLRTSCLHGAMHIVKSRRLKIESSFYFIYTFGGSELKKAKKLAFS